jgi:cell division protein FtsZ
VVASIAKELNALTVAVVTKPFTFEGKRRMQQAEKGLEELAAFVDTVIAIPNDRLLALAPRGTGVFDAFRMGHDFLRQTVADLVEIMTLPGVVNRDFSDLRSTMFGMGCALLGTATAQGENAAVEAARQAIGCPLHEDSGIRGARNVLLNLTGSSRLGLHEVNQACQLIRDATECDDVELNFGITLNEAMEDTVKVTVIATGFSGPRAAPVLEQEPSVSRTAWLSESQDEPAAAAEPLAHGEPPAAPVAKPGNGAPPLPPPEDLDDIDKPAYMRPRRMLH